MQTKQIPREHYFDLQTEEQLKCKIACNRGKELLWKRALSRLIGQLMILWNTALLETRIVVKMVNKFPTFHGSQRSVTMCTTSPEQPLLWARNQSTPPHCIALRSILISSSHLRTGVVSSIQISRLKFCTCFWPVPCSIHLNFLDVITITAYYLVQSTIMKILITHFSLASYHFLFFWSQ